MGKLISKHAYRRRESPEGGSFASNVFACHREFEHTGIHNHKVQPKQELCREEIKEDDCHLQVEMPPEQGSNRDHNSDHTVTRKTTRSSLADALQQQTECSLMKQDAQEWVFTLYGCDNSGKLTKEEMSSLMHSIYEMLQTAVRRRCGGTTALRVKLVLAPSNKPGVVPQMDKDQSLSQGFSSPEGRPYCSDENPERRNHYLDLAGIENYASKFDNTELLSPGQESCSALQQNPVAASENCNNTESQKGISILRSLRNKTKVVEWKGGGGRSSKHDGQNPAWPCQPKVQAPLQHAQRKRHNSRLQDTGLSPRSPGSQVLLEPERETLNNTPASRSCLASAAHRHEHHHHHHHEHHHHYYQT